MQADLQTLAKSWVVRVWLLLLVLSFLIVPVGLLMAARLAPVPASGVLAAYLALFLNVWSTVVIVLSAGSVSLEAEIIADGILSRACTRTQYILAKLAARGLVVLGLYALGAGAAGCAAWRYAANDMTWGTLATGVGIVAMALLMLVALGVALSALLNHTIISIIGLVLLWYAAGQVFAFLGAEYLSPASLTRKLPEILRDAGAPRVVACTATPTSVSVVFSKPMQAESAQEVNHYRIEGPEGKRHRPAAAVYQERTSTVVLSGLDLPAGEAVTVTVEGVTDLAGNPISPAADTATSEPIENAQRGKEEGGTMADQPNKGGEAKPAKGNAAPTPNQPASAPATEAGARASRPRAARTARLPRVTRVQATRASVSVTFSQDMQPDEVEDLDHYTIESPLGTTRVARTAAYSSATRTVLLSGLSFAAGQPVKVTVKGVTDVEGRALDPRHNSGIFREVQNWRYFLWFGLATVLFAVLAVEGFERRDL